MGWGKGVAEARVCQDLMGWRVSPRGDTFHFRRLDRRADALLQRGVNPPPSPRFRDLGVTWRITSPSRVYLARLPSGRVILFSCGAHYFS